MAAQDSQGVCLPNQEGQSDVQRCGPGSPPPRFLDWLASRAFVFLKVSLASLMRTGQLGEERSL